MTRTDELIPTPTWYKVLLSLEALNWLGLAAFVVLVLAIAPGMHSPEGPGLLAAYLAAAAMALATAVFIVVSLARGSARPVIQRFGMIHNLQGIVYNLPICVVFAIGIVTWDLKNALISMIYVTIVLGTPLAGFLLSRRDNTVAVWAGIVIGVLWFLGGGVVFFLSALAFAGFSA